MGKGKLGIPRFIQAYMGSCQSKNLSSIVQEPHFIHREIRDHSHKNFLETSSTTFMLPSICKPKTNELIAFKDISHKRIKPRSGDNTEVTRCPHPSPVSVQEVNKSMKRTEMKNYIMKKQIQNVLVSTNSSVATSHRFFTSDDDDERPKVTKPIMFSSNSSSSEYTCEFYQHPKKNTRRSRRRKAKRQNPDSGFIDFASIPKAVKGEIQRSVAVVKRSKDPYGDFGRSMAEMIVEKQMNTPGDLEQLLYCFLLLNSPHHHQVILEVFSEILEVLFPNWN